MPPKKGPKKGPVVPLDKVEEERAEWIKKIQAEEEKLRKVQMQRDELQREYELLKAREGRRKEEEQAHHLEDMQRQEEAERRRWAQEKERRNAQRLDNERMQRQNEFIMQQQARIERLAAEVVVLKKEVERHEASQVAYSRKDHDEVVQQLHGKLRESRRKELSVATHFSQLQEMMAKMIWKVPKSRHAVVIGVSSYDHLPSLPTAETDALFVGEFLQESCNYTVDFFVRPGKWGWEAGSDGGAWRLATRPEETPSAPTRCNILRGLAEVGLSTSGQESVVVWIGCRAFLAKGLGLLLVPSDGRLPEGYAATTRDEDPPDVRVTPEDNLIALQEVVTALCAHGRLKHIHILLDSAVPILSSRPAPRGGTICLLGAGEAICREYTLHGGHSSQPVGLLAVQLERFSKTAPPLSIGAFYQRVASLTPTTTPVSPWPVHPIAPSLILPSSHMVPCTRSVPTIPCSDIVLSTTPLPSRTEQALGTAPGGKPDSLLVVLDIAVDHRRALKTKDAMMAWCEGYLRSTVRGLCDGSDPSLKVLDYQPHSLLAAKPGVLYPLFVEGGRTGTDCEMGCVELHVAPCRGPVSSADIRDFLSVGLKKVDRKRTGSWLVTHYTECREEGSAVVVLVYCRKGSSVPYPEGVLDVECDSLPEVACTAFNETERFPQQGGRLTKFLLGTRVEAALTESEYLALLPVARVTGGVVQPPAILTLPSYLNDLVTREAQPTLFDVFLHRELSIKPRVEEAPELTEAEWAEKAGERYTPLLPGMRISVWYGGKEQHAELGSGWLPGRVEGFQPEKRCYSVRYDTGDSRGGVPLEQIILQEYAGTWRTWCTMDDDHISKKECLVFLSQVNSAREAREANQDIAKERCAGYEAAIYSANLEPWMSLLNLVPPERVQVETSRAEYTVIFTSPSDDPLAAHRTSASIARALAKECTLAAKFRQLSAQQHPFVFYYYHSRRKNEDPDTPDWGLGQFGKEVQRHLSEVTAPSVLILDRLRGRNYVLRAGSAVFRNNGVFPIAEVRAFVKAVRSGWLEDFGKETYSPHAELDGLIIGLL